ncbi:serine protease [Actinoplanes sp. NBRC 14428]|uniref:Subtilisin family serine protease n=1 Tax=Pseudosporangium ferrugineum TaxID=439699 RepID=A0A2T0S6D1_9ACTN|nr:S8 family serine peptidase [Pseudosporangium ferrugineum]PRY28833.1 subtilisin family serine protease [Pseudosporangium ferrugineum]BCJ53707.1 serine protease [Actinoplanes sp. NBRC 14428]
MRRRLTAGAVATATGLAALLVGLPAAPAGAATTTTEYTVVADDGVSTADAIAAITAAGGTVLSSNTAVGTFKVTSASADFKTRAARSDALIGASANRAIGRAPKVAPAVEQPVTEALRGKGPHGAATPDPLDDKLWGLKMVKADKARAIEKGDRGVTVGVLDTGLDASNPDLAANFSTRLSRNFAPDLVDVDGPCEVEGCVDPVGTDDGGHGTHVAGTIAAAANGAGVSGVAPNVTLVELKGGQDSGYFFLDPVVNALTYAGDAGLDVVNMSFYVDPWLYNCKASPADSPEAQAEQRAIIAGMKRALNYAHSRGVTLVGALGNQHDNLNDPQEDTTSPDYGSDPYVRPVDNATCFSLPAEGPHVIGVSALGPSKSKSHYSNYGTEQIGVSAPGGFTRDFFGTPQYNNAANNILSSYPLKVLQASGAVDAAGNPVSPTVFKSCTASGQCGYYTYLAGTSMASPHAAGVAALIVSKYGHRDWWRGGLTMNPNLVEAQLYRTAEKTACPEPRLRSYANEGYPAEFDAYCAGPKAFNSFYGHGIVDAYKAVGGR